MEISTRHPPNMGEYACWRVNLISLPATVAGSFRSLVTVCRLPPLSSVTTQGLVAFQVSDIWFRLQLFRTGTASVSVSAAAAVVASAAAHLVPTAAAAFPSIGVLNGPENYDPAAGF